MLVGTEVGEISSKFVEVAIGNDEPQVDPSGVTPGDVELRFQQTLYDAERLSQEQKQ